MSVEEAKGGFWRRFEKTTGITGVIAFLLVYASSSLDGRFDWRVFLLSGAAVFLCWARAWVLVPVYQRNAQAEEEMWNRYSESDWRFVSSVSDLSGSELDELRAIFREGHDAPATGWIKKRWSGFGPQDVQEFKRFFNEEFMDTVSAYIDEDGRLQPFT